MRSVIRFASNGTPSSACLLSSSLSSSCLPLATSVGSSCVTPTQPTSTTCMVAGSASATCLVNPEVGSLSSSCYMPFPNEAGSSCLNFPSIESSACLIKPVALSSCLVNGSVAGSCLSKPAALTSCVGTPGANGYSATRIGNSANHIYWQTLNEPDWMVIRPLYATVAGCEIRSNFYFTLRTLKSPTSPVYTFPSVETLIGFNSGTALKALTATGSVITITTAATGVLPLNTNIETLYPTLIGGYQTDSFTGPSEKILVSIKRLRALGFDLVDFRFSVNYISTNFGATSVPVELSLYQGGSPQVISTGGTTTDWSFPSSTLLMKETIYTRDAKRVTSLATADTMLTFNLSLSQRGLIFYPVP